MKFELKQEVYDGLDGICFGAFDRQEKLPVNEMMDELMHLEGLPVHCPYHHYITRYGICQALFFLKTHYLYKKYIYAAFYLRGPPGNTPEKQRSSERFPHACNKMPDIAHYVGFIGSIAVLSQNVYRLG